MKFLIFLTLILFVYSGLDCEDMENEEMCINNELTLEDSTCCSVSYKKNVNDISQTFECIEILKMISNNIENKQVLALFREGILFNGEDEIDMNIFGDDTVKEITLECKDGSIELDSNFLNFSREAKNLISNGHCLEYYYSSQINDMEATREKCTTGKFSQYGTDAGLKCVYSEITFRAGSEKNNFQVCFPFIDEDLSNGKLNDFTKSFLDELSKEMFPNEEDVYYEIQIRGDGISARYNSKTGKLANNTSIYYMVKIYMYLILFWFILF